MFLSIVNIWNKKISVNNWNCEITGLDLTQPNILNELAVFLQKYTTISSLNLSNNNITDDILEQISQYLFLNWNLKSLDLSFNKIKLEKTNKFKNYLEQHSNIETLILSYNPINDKGIQTLSDIVKNNNSLTQIDTFEINVSTWWIIDFFSAIPGWKNIKSIRFSLENFGLTIIPYLNDLKKFNELELNYIENTK